MRKWSERSLKNLHGIHPDLRRVMDRALEISEVDFIVIEGLRSVARQKELLAAGATKILKSRHITGHAVDLLPINPRTKKGEFAWPLYHRLAKAVKQAAQDEGVRITWGGDWTKFKDGPHFELNREAYPEGKWETQTVLPAERKSPAQSTTVQASVAQIATGMGGAVAAIGALDGTAQIVALGIAAVVVIAAAWVMRERLRRWADGDR